MSRIVFSPIPRGHYDVLRLALEAARLPTDDLAEPRRAFFQLSDDQGRDGPQAEAPATTADKGRPSN